MANTSPFRYSVQPQYCYHGHGIDGVNIAHRIITATASLLLILIFATFRYDEKDTDMA